MTVDGISIIICAYNAAARIEKTLEALQQQQLGQAINWEVIVVDNASTDSTAETATKVWSRKPITGFKILKEEKPGLMNARHCGLKAAAFEIVSFIDDDNWVEERWIEKVYNIFSADEKTGACGGRSEAVFEKEEPEWFSLFENSFAVGSQAASAGYVDDTKGFLWGAGLSFRKSLWFALQQRGFSNLTIGRQGKSITAGEDTELCYAFRLLGYKLYYSPDLSLKHFMPASRMQFSYLEKMSEGFGKAFARLNCYRQLLYPRTFELKPWWHEWLASQKKIAILRVTKALTRNKKVKWKRKAERAYWKGYADQLWLDKQHLHENVLTLKKIFRLWPV
jgi:glycosyltransferase involved in cell wall biosynthesis